MCNFHSSLSQEQIQLRKLFLPIARTNSTANLFHLIAGTNSAAKLFLPIAEANSAGEIVLPYRRYNSAGKLFLPLVGSHSAAEFVPLIGRNKFRSKFGSCFRVERKLYLL